MSDEIPITLNTVHCTLSHCKDDFLPYVVCLSCDSLYEYDDYIGTSISGRHKKSKHYRHIQYLNHNNVSKRVPCGPLLLKKVKIKGSYNKYLLKSDLLNTIDTFAWTKDMEAVCPLSLFYEKVFSGEEVHKLSDIYL